MKVINSWSRSQLAGCEAGCLHSADTEGSPTHIHACGQCRLTSELNKRVCGLWEDKNIHSVHHVIDLSAASIRSVFTD